MSLESLVAHLRARDIALVVEGNQLVYDAPEGEMTPEDLAVLRRHKAELVDYLAGRVAERPAPSEAPADYWRPIVESWPEAVAGEWEERASIMHFDGGLPLHSAEFRAFQEVASSPIGLAMTRAGDDPEAIRDAMERHGYSGPAVAIEVELPRPQSREE